MKLGVVATFAILFALSAFAQNKNQASNQNHHVKPKVAFYVVATAFKSVSPGTMYSYVDQATGKPVTLDLSKPEAANTVKNCVHGPVNHPDFQRTDVAGLIAYVEKMMAPNFVANFGQTYKKAGFAGMKKKANDGCPLSKDGFSGPVQRITVTAWYPESSVLDPKTPKRSVVCDFARASAKAAFNQTVQVCRSALDRF
ncbi:MAG: hypothetical protein JNL01_14370 [Bdellovibrionales bacterium]|nr:hypothetical protein [Bdellovibrionales bacterium]